MRTRIPSSTPGPQTAPPTVRNARGRETSERFSAGSTKNKDARPRALDAAAKKKCAWPAETKARSKDARDSAGSLLSRLVSEKEAQSARTLSPTDSKNKLELRSKDDEPNDASRARDESLSEGALRSLSTSYPQNMELGVDQVRHETCTKSSALTTKVAAALAPNCEEKAPITESTHALRIILENGVAMRLWTASGALGYRIEQGAELRADEVASLDERMRGVSGGKAPRQGSTSRGGGR